MNVFCQELHSSRLRDRIFIIRLTCRRHVPGARFSLIGNLVRSGIALTMHACAKENTSFPLCGAKKFRYVTLDLPRVTCERCLSLIGAIHVQTPLHQDSAPSSEARPYSFGERRSLRSVSLP